MSMPEMLSPSKTSLEDTPTKKNETGLEPITFTDLKGASPSPKYEITNSTMTAQEDDLSEFSLQTFKLPKYKGGLASRMMKRAGSSQDPSGSALGPNDLTTDVSAAVAPPSIHPALSNLAAHSSLFESFNNLDPSVEETPDTAGFPASTSQLVSSVTGPSAKPQVSSKKTYGGTSRSMLANAEVGSDGEGEGKKRESYLTLAKRWGVDESQELKEVCYHYPLFDSSCFPACTAF